jgi:hypothetical protein
VSRMFAAPRSTRRPRARSSVGTGRPRTAFCSRTITCPLNHRRYHEGLQNLTPANVSFGRGQTVLLERERIKSDAIKLRRLKQHRPDVIVALRVGDHCGLGIVVDVGE